MTYEPQEAQRDVITSTAPILVVLGGAGTGKTTTAVAAARTCLEATDQRLDAARREAIRRDERLPLPASQRALFLSFSRTAVAQVLDRSAPVVGSVGHRLEVATFHGFAWRVVTGFGVHHGHPAPQTVLSEANRRVPGAPPGLTYDQLIPAARALLKIPKIRDHYASRYAIVICDEFQDTDAQEWDFLQSIAPAARRILLGDVNQCIYKFKVGVDPATRIAAASAMPGAVRIDLPPVSHRDPSGVLPAAADAARVRSFNHPAIRRAADTGRLRVTRITDGIGHAQVVDLTREARHRGHTVAVFTHTNAATSALSDALTDAGLAHEQVGFGEAYGEALAAQLALIRFALNHRPAPVRRNLAVYIAAVHGGKKLPPLANHMLNGANAALERAIASLATDLGNAGGIAPDIDRVADLVAGAWARVGTTRGEETWNQAARRTRGALRRLGEDHDLAPVTAELLNARDRSLVGNQAGRRRTVQVMNLHQTKGREADTTILLLGADDYYGGEGEPFPDGSRLLYVVMTRARHQAHIVVPATSHPLWRPLIEALE